MQSNCFCDNHDYHLGRPHREQLEGRTPTEASRAGSPLSSPPSSPPPSLPASDEFDLSTRVLLLNRVTGVCMHACMRASVRPSVRPCCAMRACVRACCACCACVLCV